MCVLINGGKGLNKVVPVVRGYQEVGVWQEEGGSVI